MVEVTGLEVLLSGASGLVIGGITGAIDNKGVVGERKNKVVNTLHASSALVPPAALLGLTEELGTELTAAMMLNTGTQTMLNTLSSCIGVRAGYAGMQKLLYHRSYKILEDHHMTALQALNSETRWGYISPSTYRVTHKIDSINDLRDIRTESGSEYDLIPLDRDLSLHGYHSKKREPEFEQTLRLIAHKSEIISNSSYDELRKIRDIFGDLMPISKLVRLKGQGDTPYLLRFEEGRLNIYSYHPQQPKWKRTVNVTGEFTGQGEDLNYIIAYSFKKPNPWTVTSVIAANLETGRITLKDPDDEPKVLMVGDRYFTDIAAGNHARVDTAKVIPYKWWTEYRKPVLLAVRMLDSPVGFVMSRIDAISRAFS